MPEPVVRRDNVKTRVQEATDVWQPVSVLLPIISVVPRIVFKRIAVPANPIAAMPIPGGCATGNVVHPTNPIAKRIRPPVNAIVAPAVIITKGVV